MAGMNRNAKLTLSLVDQFSRPAKVIQGAARGLYGAMNAFKTVAVAPGRAATAAAHALRRNASDMAMAGAALSLGVKSAADQIYDMEKVLNQIEGLRFGKDNTFGMADGQIMTREQFRKSVTDLIMMIDRETPRNAAEIGKAYKQLVQAGLSHEQVEAILPIAVKFSIAGDYDTEAGAEKLTQIITAMGMPKATFDEATSSAQRAADVIAYAAAKSTTDVQGMTEAFKYAAPAAAALGIDIEQLAGMFMMQANAGVKGSEAGVAIRAMLVRMVRPTKMAAAALANYGIDLQDYLVATRKVSATDISKVLQLGGLDVSGSADKIQAVLDKGLSTAEKVKQLTEIIATMAGDKSTLSRDTISSMISETLFSFGEQLDVERLVEDMEQANIAVSDFFKIFDVRQGARTMNLFKSDMSAVIEQIRAAAVGFNDALSETMMKGIVGAVQGAEAAWLRFIRTLADTGVLASATAAFNRMTDGLNELAKVNPRLLELATYGTLALAALAPLGFVIAGVTAAAGFLLNPITMIAAALGYLAYLNWDKIVAFGTEFGRSFKANMGPETKKLVDDMRASVDGLWESTKRAFSEWDGAGAGATSGGALASWIEGAIVQTKQLSSMFSDMASSVSGNSYFQSAVENVKALGNVFYETGSLLVRWVGSVKDGLVAFGKAFYDNLSPETIGYVKTFYGTLAEGWKAIVDGLTSTYKTVSTFLSGINTDFSGAAAAAGKWSAEMVNKLASGEAMAALKSAAQSWYAAGSQMVQSLWDGAVAKFNEFVGWLKSIPSKIIAAIGNIDLSGLIKWPSMPKIFGGGPRTGGGFGGEEPPAGTQLGALGGFKDFGGARARGGPVQSGLSYLIGEEGPELLKMGGSGHVTSNKDLQAANGNHVNMPVKMVVNVYGESDWKKAEARATKMMRRSSQIAFGGTKLYGDT